MENLMPKIKLTANAVRDLPAPATGKQVFYLDQTLQGFGVRVGASSRVYFCETRVAGRTRRVTIGPANVFTPDAARKEAKKLLGQMASGQDINAAKAVERARTITLAEALEIYLKGRALKENTAKANRYLIEHYFSDYLKRELKSLTPAMLVARFDKITAASGEATANGAFRVFRAVYNYARAATAANDGSYTLPENPVRRVSDLRKWHRPRRKQSYLTDDLFPAFFAAIRDLRSDRHPGHAQTFSDYIETVLRTGLRRTEAATIRWSDVNLKNKTITIRDTKNHSDHCLPMSVQLFALFQRRYDARVDDFVFYEPGPKRAIADPRKNLDKVQKAVGFALGFHDLRRTFAVVADRLDLSAYALKRLLNHSQAADVTAGYVVGNVERLRDPMQRISDEIDRLAAAI